MALTLKKWLLELVVIQNTHVSSNGGDFVQIYQGILIAILHPGNSDTLSLLFKTTITANLQGSGGD